MQENVLLKRVSEEWPNGPSFSKIMHNLQNCCVLDAGELLDVLDSRLMHRIQVDYMDALGDTVFAKI